MLIVLLLLVCSFSSSSSSYLGSGPDYTAARGPGPASWPPVPSLFLKGHTVTHAELRVLLHVSSTFFTSSSGPENSAPATDLTSLDPGYLPELEHIAIMKSQKKDPKRKWQMARLLLCGWWAGV